MNQILDKIRDVDPNDSDAVKDVVSSFIHQLPRNRDYSNNRWLRTLENVINRFPKYCGTHRATVEQYLTNFLDSSNYYTVIDAAKCAHALQQVRAPQDKGSTAKSSWRDQMSSLCGAALLLIEASYSKTNNIYKGNKGQKEPPNPSSPLQCALLEIDTLANTQDAANKNNVLSTRLRNVFVFIQAMLVEIYPVAKPIRPQLILEVILKALSSSGNKTSAEVANIKIEALKTLDALNLCLGSNMVPFSTLVFRFVMQTLRWSSENPSQESSKVRVTAYASLSRWLRVVGAYRGLGARARWDRDLTAHVVHDVTPRTRIVQLTATTQSMKNLSKKARKRLANTMLNESNISNYMPGEKNKVTLSEESNEEIVLAALECLETFLTVCGLFLEPVIHKQIQELLVRECFKLQSYSPKKGIHLLRAMEASRKCGASVPPPTQYCLHLYSTLVNYHDREISSFCSHALLDIRLHLHCSPPSLSFALERQTECNKKEAKRKHISERNRAVLESLLGKERMPSEDLREEVITITDEPNNKKSRTEVSDQISLSSGDSVDSIEISDDDVQEQIIIENVEELEQIENVVELNIEPVIEMNEESSSDVEIDEHDAPSQEFDTKITNDVTINTEVDKNKDLNIETVDVEALSSEEDLNATQKEPSIHNVETQLPINLTENYAADDKSPVSMEVSYDYPNTGQEKVKVLEKPDDENLPSTNETDDIQITCGQIVQSSQDDTNKSKDVELNDKVNGYKNPEAVQNGDATELEKDRNKDETKTSKDDVTVEDMLADFVDEVADESVTQA